jgi:outer membrane protein TolC
MKRFCLLKKSPAGLVALLLATTPPALAETAPNSIIASTGGVTLAECYRKARQISETLGISRQNILLVAAQYREKLGAILPHVDWIQEQFYQQQVSGASGTAATLLLPTQPESYFQLVQPLFAGLRDWKTLDIAKSMKQQSRFDEQQTQLQLLSDVAAAFYAAMTAHEQITTLQETRQLTQDRIKELTRWVDIGRSLSSDLLSAQTELATLDAQIQDAKRTEMETRELLRFLTGVDPQIPLVDDRTPPAPLTLPEALERSSRRPDLMSMEEVVRQSHLNVQYALSSYWPTLGLLAHSYTERVGFYSDVRWDATFTLDVPLLEGGANHAQVQEARAQNIIAELTLARLRRTAEQQVRAAQQDLTDLISEADAYAKAVDLNQKNYRAQLEEYRLGRITNIEVLQVLTNLQQVKQQWVAAKYSTKLDDVALRVAMGEGL